jgi:hypothetical protein
MNGDSMMIEIDEELLIALREENERVYGKSNTENYDDQQLVQGAIFTQLDRYKKWPTYKHILA